MIDPIPLPGTTPLKLVTSHGQQPILPERDYVMFGYLLSQIPSIVSQ